MRFRLEEALRLLDTTDHSLVEIATKCGYYDQSDFTRHFRRAVGWSPAGWRSLTRASANFLWPVSNRVDARKSSGKLPVT